MTMLSRFTLSSRWRSAVLLLVAACLGGAGPTVATAWAQPAAPGAAAPQDKQDFSAAERLLFMGRPLVVLKPPLTLKYSFRKSGALEEGYSDSVTLKLQRAGNGACCSVVGEFLSGPRRLSLPEIELAEANPVLLYFLEHDVREMERLTKGKQAYYRKRLRLAAYDSATVTPVSLSYRGAAITGQQVEMSPYLNDPARSRFEKHARKSYRFWLSDAVPGGVFGIRSVMRSEAADAPPMIVEELYLEGAEAPTASPTR